MSKNKIKYTVKGQTGILEKDFDSSESMAMFAIQLVLVDDGEIQEVIVNGENVSPFSSWNKTNAKESMDKVFHGKIDELKKQYDRGEIESAIILSKSKDEVFKSEIFTGGTKFNKLEWAGFLGRTSTEIFKVKNV